MIKLELNQGADEAVLQIKGEMGLADAAELKAALLELAASSGTLRIDCAKVDRVDLAGLQLLCSAVRSAGAQQRQLLVDVSDLPVFQQAISAAGLPAGWNEFLNAEQNKGVS